MSKARREIFEIAVDVLNAINEVDLLQADIMKKCLINNYQCKRVTDILISIDWINIVECQDNDLRKKFKYKITKTGYEYFQFLNEIKIEFRNAVHKKQLNAIN